MEGTTEKDCSPLWNLYQQIVSDMKPYVPGFDTDRWRYCHCRNRCTEWFAQRRERRTSYEEYQYQFVFNSRYPGETFPTFANPPTNPQRHADNREMPVIPTVTITPATPPTPTPLKVPALRLPRRRRLLPMIPCSPSPDRFYRHEDMTEPKDWVRPITTQPRLTIRPSGILETHL